MCGTLIRVPLLTHTFQRGPLPQAGAPSPSAPTPGWVESGARRLAWVVSRGVQSEQDKETESTPLALSCTRMSPALLNGVHVCQREMMTVSCKLRTCGVMCTDAQSTVQHVA